MTAELETDQRTKENLSNVRVSVVISTRNGARLILNSLNTLLAGDRAPDEIVVLDQSDTDATKLEVQKAKANAGDCDIRYIASTRPGLCAHRNDALAATTGDFIASIDDDITVASDWLKRMLEEWDSKWDRQPVLLTGRILPAPEFEPGALITAIRASEERKVFSGKPKLANVLIGGQFGASRELFERMQPMPFDERLGIGSRFMGADDDEFAYRVMQNGFPVVFEPAILCVHHTLRVSKWRHAQVARAVGTGASIGKHVVAGDLSQILFLFEFIAIQWVKGFKSLLKFEEPRGTARLLASFAIVFGFAKWVSEAAIGTLEPADFRQPGSPAPEELAANRVQTTQGMSEM